MKETPYTLAKALNDMGFTTITNPYDKAKEGNVVFVIVPTNAARAVYQRMIYQKLLTDKMPIKEARSGKIFFSSGGKIIIVIPDEPLSVFQGLDKAVTFINIFRE